MLNLMQLHRSSCPGSFLWQQCAGRLERSSVAQHLPNKRTQTSLSVKQSEIWVGDYIFPDLTDWPLFDRCASSLSWPNAFLVLLLWVASARNATHPKELEIIWGWTPVKVNKNKQHTSERVETDWTSCNTASDKLAASFRISNACRKKMYFKYQLIRKMRQTLVVRALQARICLRKNVHTNIQK